MVCIHCGNNTRVINSRLQKRNNSVWRRRICATCHSLFTSIEEIDKQSALRVGSNNSIKPYSPDKLFISIYESCKHRPSAIEDARALSSTVFTKLSYKQSNGLIKSEEIKQTVLETLKHFDQAAMVHYQAYFL